MTERESDTPLSSLIVVTKKKRSRDEEGDSAANNRTTDLDKKIQRLDTMDSVIRKLPPDQIAEQQQHHHSQWNNNKQQNNCQSDKDEQISNDMTTSMGRLYGLRLEAIFYPKFDNEVVRSSNNDNHQQMMRKDMLSKVKDGNGYLEVTLKHSGSLILWSGYDRYYSKNSMNNIFTQVGEILLRQHFARSWESCQRENHTKPTQQQQQEPLMNEVLETNEAKYYECSDYVARNKLTLSFEVVTACLGHHGAIPNRDYLVLTAVANRKTAQFMSTSDLIRFAQMFRLPHNDTWIFTSIQTAQRLFNLYDSLREKGFADDVIPELTKSADCDHVQSIYPHSVFQGNILEGVVIRYVPYTSSETDSSHKHEQMKELASVSSSILKLIPPEKPLIHESSSSKNTVLKTNLRALRKKLPIHKEAFQKEIQPILLTSNGVKDPRDLLSQVNVIKNKAMKATLANQTSNTNFPSFVRDHIIEKNNGELDEQTMLILNLLKTLDSLGEDISYKIFHEKNEN